MTTVMTRREYVHHLMSAIADSTRGAETKILRSDPAGAQESLNLAVVTMQELSRAFNESLVIGPSAYWESTFLKKIDLLVADLARACDYFTDTSSMSIGHFLDAIRDANHRVESMLTGLPLYDLILFHGHES